MTDQMCSQSNLVKSKLCRDDSHWLIRASWETKYVFVIKTVFHAFQCVNMLDGVIAQKYKPGRWQFLVLVSQTNTCISRSFIVIMKLVD